MIVCFDLNGTLTDVRALTGDDRGLIVFDRALMLAMADTLSGAVRPLPEYFREVLERDLPELAEAAMERLPRLPAQPEAADALQVLRDAGHRVAVVTNSAREAAEASLEAAGCAPWSTTSWASTASASTSRTRASTPTRRRSWGRTTSPSSPRTPGTSPAPAAPGGAASWWITIAGRRCSTSPAR